MSCYWHVKWWWSRNPWKSTHGSVSFLPPIQQEEMKEISSNYGVLATASSSFESTDYIFSLCRQETPESIPSRSESVSQPTCFGTHSSCCSTHSYIRNRVRTQNTPWQTSPQPQLPVSSWVLYGLSAWSFQLSSVTSYQIHIVRPALAQI